MSDYRKAVKQMLAIELRLCPKCGDCDVPKAAPTLQLEQNGSLTCTTCGHNFVPLKEK